MRRYGGWRQCVPACLAALALASAAPGWPAHAAAAGLSAGLAQLRAEAAQLREERIQLAQASDAARFARYEVRLGQLEEELRRLTGRVERLEYEQRTIQTRLDELVATLDGRLGALEAAVRQRAGMVAPEPAPEGASESAARLAPDPGIQSPGVPPPAPREDVLGSVPERALLDLPRPSPQAATAPPRRSLPPQEQYDAAMELLRAGNYQAAADGLQLFLEMNPDHPLSPNAAYWLAETYYVRKNHAAAAAAFARNYRTYGRDALKAPDNLLKLGMALQELGESEKACLSYQELAEEFPDAPAHIRQALDRERSRAQCV